jgi:hypothetical protein
MFYIVFFSILVYQFYVPPLNTLGVVFYKQAMVNHGGKAS